MLKNYALKAAETLLKKIKGHQINENIHMNGLGLVLVRYQYPKQLMEPVQCAWNAVCIKSSVHQTQCASNAVCIKCNVHQMQRASKLTRGHLSDSFKLASLKKKSKPIMKKSPPKLDVLHFPFSKLIQNDSHQVSTMMHKLLVNYNYEHKPKLISLWANWLQYWDHFLRKKTFSNSLKQLDICLQENQLALLISFTYKT